MTTPPELPARATITSFVIADAVGTLALERGGQLRFGRSACKGFEPVVGASVIVEQLGADLRGFKAKVVALDPGDARYDALLGARDAAQGLPRRTLGGEQAAATARQLALVTILLREPLPEGTQALRTWTSAHGFPRDGYTATAERDLELAVPSGGVLSYVGRERFPSAGLDLRDAGDAFDLGRSFIGLGIGIPGQDRRARQIRAGSFAPWAPGGKLRELSALVRMLADHATGVILHRAGDLVVPIGDFVRMLGDLADPLCQPFAAWIDVAILQRRGASYYATFGMDAFGLPDVLARIDREDATSRTRGHEAALYAAYLMVRENRELAPGETVRVPVGVQIGAWPVERPGGETLTYVVSGAGEQLELVG